MNTPRLACKSLSTWINAKCEMTVRSPNAKLQPVAFQFWIPCPFQTGRRGPASYLHLFYYCNLQLLYTVCTSGEVPNFCWPEYCTCSMYNKVGTNQSIHHCTHFAPNSVIEFTCPHQSQFSLNACFWTPRHEENMQTRH